MIEIFTTTQIEATGFDKDYRQTKRVVMTMDPDDAMVLYTLIANSQETMSFSSYWQNAFSSIAQELLDAGNKCR
jgi:hypothetical protein